MMENMCNNQSWDCYCLSPYLLNVNGTFGLDFSRMFYTLDRGHVFQLSKLECIIVLLFCSRVVCASHATHANDIVTLVDSDIFCS